MIMIFKITLTATKCIVQVMQNYQMIRIAIKTKMKTILMVFKYYIFILNEKMIYFTLLCART